LHPEIYTKIGLLVEGKICNFNQLPKNLYDKRNNHYTKRTFPDRTL
jgi:hypothetical protein